jgi:hypothetical protein
MISAHGRDSDLGQRLNKEIEADERAISINGAPTSRDRIAANLEELPHPCTIALLNAL